MATQLFLGEPFAVDSTPPGNLSSDSDQPLMTSRGSSSTTRGVVTVTGPTSGIQIGSTPVTWWYRVNAVTISGAITKNLWMFESNMSANAGAQTIIDRCDSTGAFISTVENSEFGTEMPVTTATAQNWSTGTVTSTSFSAGDYIRLRVYANDAGGTMASGFTANLNAGGPTAGADGDSYITFTETITAYTPSTGKAPPFRHHNRLIIR